MSATPREVLPTTETVQRTVLDNGIIVLVYENPHVESVVLQGSLSAGSAYESFSHNGLSSMTASLLMNGTQSRDFDTLYSTLEDIGAELEFDTSRTRTHVDGRALAEDLPTLLDIMADALRYPIFPADEVQQERQKRLTELNYAQQNPRYMASRTFRRALYPKTHPFHYSTYGSLKSLPRITADELAAFHSAYYTPQGMILTIVGNVNAGDVVAQVEDAIGDWRGADAVPSATLQTIELPPEQLRTHTDIAGTSQTDIMIGTVGPSRSHEDYVGASLLNSILGEFGMMGRIGNVIREQLGLAYYAYSRLEGGKGPSAWYITAGVAPENVELTIKKSFQELETITTELVSETDLDDNQSYFVGRLPLRLESITGVAAILHRLEEHQLGLDYLVRYREVVNAITREQLLDIAQRYLNPQQMVIATAGQ